MSENTGIPDQNLINLYLRGCVQSGRKISMYGYNNQISKRMHLTGITCRVYR